MGTLLDEPVTFLALPDRKLEPVFLYGGAAFLVSLAALLLDLVRTSPLLRPGFGVALLDLAREAAFFVSGLHLVIDRLLEAGHPVVPIHPNAFHATRPRWGASKAKSDPGDSFKLADYLRTEGGSSHRP